MPPNFPPDREPIFNLPAVVVASLAVLLAIHGLRWFLDERTELEWLFELAFIPAVWTVALDGSRVSDVLQAVTSDGGGQALARVSLARYILSDPSPNYWSFLSHAVLHGSWMHVMFNCLWLAAFGSPVARRIGPARFLALACLAALGGAVAHLIARPLDVTPMIGASGAVSGLMAAAARFVFSPNTGGEAHEGARQSLADLTRNRSALFFIGIWFVTNFAVGVFATPLGLSDGGIAWEAHVGGFLVGLLAFAAFDRPPRPA